MIKIEISYTVFLVTIISFYISNSGRATPISLLLSQ